MHVPRRIMSPTWQTSALAALLLILLAGCAAPWPFPQPTPDPKLPDAQQIFRPLEIGPIAGDVATLDPALIFFDSCPPRSCSQDYQLAQLIFPGLVTLDERQRPMDWAAQSHEVSSDGLTYTFHLRAGMTWSDGTPIDATTFAYSINRALDPCTHSDVASYLYLIKGAAEFNGSPSSGGGGYSQADACPQSASKSATTLIGSSLLVPDPLTLQIKLERPAGYFLSELAYPTSWAVPKQLIDQYADRWTDHLTDNGGFGGNLFILTSWRLPAGNNSDATPTTPTDGLGHITLERNPRFWGQKPLLRRVEYSLYKDNVAAWSAFASGAGDAVTSPPAAYLDAARNLPGTAYHETPRLATTFLRPNWKLAPFDDVRVRKAFWLAIDRQTLAHDKFYPPAISNPLFPIRPQPTTHLLIEGLPEYNPHLLDPAGRSGTAALGADLTAARALAASYAADRCRGELQHCAQVSYYFYGGGGGKAWQLGPALVQQWQAAFPGWPISYSWCDRCAQLDDANGHELNDGGWVADYPDGQDVLSSLWRTGIVYNRTYVSVPVVDTFLDQADVSNDQAQRTRLYQQTEQLLVDQVAAIPLYQTFTRYVVRKHIVGWRIAPTLQTPLPVWQTAYLTK